MATDRHEAVFRGVGVALVTCFDDAGDLDAAATAALAEQLCARGVSAVVVAGTTGEAATLEPQERCTLVEAVRAALPDRVPVVAGTGAPSARQAVAYTAGAVDAGADAVLVLSPPGTDDPRRYYEQVAAAAGPVPVLAYHFPAVSPPGIPVPVLAELPVAGGKDSSGDPDRLLDELVTVPGALYTGSVSLCLLAGALGAAGAILAMANVEPERCARAFAGDADAARELVPLNRTVRQGGIPTLKRLVAERFGVPAHARVA